MDRDLDIQDYPLARLTELFNGTGVFANRQSNQEIINAARGQIAKLDELLGQLGGEDANNVELITAQAQVLKAAITGSIISMEASRAAAIGEHRAQVQQNIQQRGGQQ